MPETSSQASFPETPRKPTWLLDHQQRVHSQMGEDGVLGKLLELMPKTDRWCVEFGAWDGVHLTNTRRLIDESNYSAVLIEGDETRFADLRRNYAGCDRVIPLNAYVGFSDRNGLDRLLADTPIPKDFDLISIDVDGNDYHIWHAMIHYRPKIICIEYNPTIPTEVRFVQPADPKINQGASLLSLVELGKQKGYELASVLPLNAVFVDAQYFRLLGISDNRPETLRQDFSYVTYLFSGYDGTVFLSGQQQLPWHGVALRPEQVQPLPGFLRRFRDSYSTPQKLAFRLFRAIGRARQKLTKAWQSMGRRAA